MAREPALFLPVSVSHCCWGRIGIFIDTVVILIIGCFYAHCYPDGTPFQREKPRR